jgi:hypothetical protein
MQKTLRWRTGCEIALAFVFAMGGASAVAARPVHRHHHCAAQMQPEVYVTSSADHCASADCERRRYDESGTVGRNGLGADPYHPEGPGNISN